MPTLVTFSKQPGTKFRGMEYYIGYTYFSIRWSTYIFRSIESGWGKSLLASLGPSWSNIKYPKKFSHFLVSYLGHLLQTRKYLADYNAIGLWTTLTRLVLYEARALFSNSGSKEGIKRVHTFSNVSPPIASSNNYGESNS